MSDKKTLRVKNMMYEQQVDHLPPSLKSLDDVIECIQKKVSPKKYAAILHDKDINDKGNPVAPNIHVMMSFDNARSINSVARCLGDKPQSIEAWSGRAENGYAYLIHATDNARAKHQYDVSEVKANFDYPAMIQNISKKVADANKYGDSARVKTMLNMLYAGEITMKELESQLNGALYGKAHREIKAVFAKRLELIAEEWRDKMIAEGRNVRVIWIYGTAGTGKTSLAKKYAEKHGNPFCMAGSSKDKFQNYAGEHTLILDELRPKDIPYHDFLRITDPFGSDTPVMAPARYSDKALACDLIIITSPYDPVSYYNGIPRLDMVVDSFEQLRRRISLTVIMTQKEIFAAEYDSTTRRYMIDAKSGRPNPYSSASRPTQAADAKEIFNEMFD